MGHVGLTPQTATALGGFKAQGKTADGAVEIAEDALALQAVGCFAIVFEAIPAGVTEVLMPKMRGAGDRDRRRAGTDGQVLVFHDLLGIYGGHAPKFVKRYAERPRGDGRAGSASTRATSASAPSRHPSTPTRSSPRSWRRFGATSTRRASRAPSAATGRRPRSNRITW